MRHRFVPMLTAAVLLTAASLAAAPTVRADGTQASPEEFIRSIADDVLAVLRDDSLDADAKRARLERELDSCCDFETTSKLVLARNWRKFSPEQQREFVALFKRYLIVTYQGNIDAYGGETVEISGGREEARGDYTVMTQIKRQGAEDIAVDYRLRRIADGSWRIIDVIAEGISLVSNLRSQFQEVVSRRGPEGLLGALREKTADRPASGTRDAPAPPGTIGATRDPVEAPAPPPFASLGG